MEAVTLSSGPQSKSRLTQRAHRLRHELANARIGAERTLAYRPVARAESGREFAVVLLVALIGVLLAAGVVLAPWHPAEATPAPITGFVTTDTGQH